MDWGGGLYCKLSKCVSAAQVDAAGDKEGSVSDGEVVVE